MNKPILITRPVLLFALAFSLLIIGLQALQPSLLYQREAILAGEAWRLWSGNLIHTNLYHMLLNLAGFWIFLLLCGAVLPLKLLISSIFFAATLIGCALLILHPEIEWYAGLSGVLYALFVVGAACLAMAGEMLIFCAFLTLIILKLGSSWLGDADAMTQQMIAARIIEEAHLYGVLAGVLIVAFWLPYTLWHRQKQRNSAQV